MIAPGQRLPMVQWRNCRSVPLSVGWLTESLVASAERAGARDWSWSGEVAKAISHYLEHEFDGQTITTDQLTEVLRRSLRGIGCGEIALRATVVAPRVSIYLPDLARQTGMELLFFRLLRHRLEEAMEVVVRGVRLEGIRPCVKILGGSKTWRSRCEALSDEIVMFTRQQMHGSSRPPVDLVIV
ncbi:MAG: hypothetical protein OHK005_20190 [Candidatus Methylacidiphilales bacterium]